MADNIQALDNQVYNTLFTPFLFGSESGSTSVTNILVQRNLIVNVTNLISNATGVHVIFFVLPFLTFFSFNLILLESFATIVFSIPKVLEFKFLDGICLHRKPPLLKETMSM